MDRVRTPSLSCAAANLLQNSKHRPPLQTELEIIATVAGAAGAKMGNVQRPSQSCLATQNLLHHPSHVCHLQPTRNRAPCPTLPLTVIKDGA